MTRYIVGRIVQAIAVLWAAFTLTFAILYLLPSDPMQLQLAAAGVQEDSLTEAAAGRAEAQVRPRPVDLGAVLAPPRRRPAR